MVRYGGISMEAHTELVIVGGRAMTPVWYICHVLEPQAIPFALFVGNELMLMHENALTHIVRIVSLYLDKMEIQRMNWDALIHEWDQIDQL